MQISTVLSRLALAGVAACASNSSSELPSRQTTSSVIALPGDAFYPENLSVAADGTLYVSSVGGGGIVRLGPSSEVAEPFVTTSKNITGVYVDDDAALLYACENDLSAMPAVAPRVLAFHLADGTQAAAYPFPQGGVCNDFVLGPAHNLYVTDSSGRIYVLRPGSAALALVTADPSLAPTMAGGFGADGIVWDGDATLYVTGFSDNKLLQVALAPDGSARAVTPVTVTPALQGPDGMRLVDAHTVVIAEWAGQLSQLELHGDTATGHVVASGLVSPTSVALTQGAYWVTEGQIAHFLGLDTSPPGLPFDVRRVAHK
ncbi:MAG TPA: hypothetical protein VH165_36660 [Kofleriaceae bacterium]|jgi:sugar lactone lactonase YvrE|nr:hypothetical protein [Kofleriaceae bacterium]